MSSDQLNLNPFVTKGPVIDRKMQAKVEDFDKILFDIIAKGDWFSLLGARQNGKTTVMKMLEEEIEKRPNLVSIYINLEEFSHIKSNFIYHFNKKVLSLLLENSKLNEYFRDIREIKIDKSSSVSNVFCSISESVKNKIRIVLLLDEYTALKYGNIMELLPNLRSAFHYSEVSKMALHSTVLADVRTPMSAEYHSANSPFNITTNINIGNLDKDEAINILKEGFGRGGFDLSGNMATIIYEKTNGKAYLVQKIGEVIFDNLNNRNNKQVSEDDIEKAISSILDYTRDDNHFSRIRIEIDRFIKEENVDVYLYIEKMLSGEKSNQNSAIAQHLFKVVGVLDVEKSGGICTMNEIYRRFFLLEIQRIKDEQRFKLKVDNTPNPSFLKNILHVLKIKN